MDSLNKVESRVETRAAKRRRLLESESESDSAAIQVDSDAASDSTPLNLSSMTSSSSYASSISTAASQSSLYTDVMHCILRFLSFRDLIPVTKLNREWKSAVFTLRPRLLGDIIVPPSIEDVKPSSALLPHVSMLDISNWGDMHPLALSVRFSLFSSLESIKGLEIGVRYQSCKRSNIPFPSSLTSIQLELLDGCTLRQSLIDSLSHVVHLKHLIIGTNQKVKLVEISSKSKAPIDFTPFLRLTALEELTIRFFAARWLDDAAADEIVEPHMISFLTVVSRMNSLRALDFGGASKSHLRLLTDNPSQLQCLHQLQRLNTLKSFDESYTRLLQRLPSLTELETYECSVEDATFLHSFSYLVKLRLGFIEDVSEFIPTVANLLLSMANLVTLEDLHLDYPFADGNDLRLLLTPLKRLTTFSGVFLSALNNLSAFEAGNSIAESLTSLELTCCPLIDLSEIWKIQNLRKLKKLKIVNSFDEKLCSCAREMFEPTSPHLIIPSLEVFEYDNDDRD